jgi:hypothetical protein
MRVIGQQGEIPCLRALESGKEITLTILDDKEPTKRKLQVRLPNDGEFRRVYADICNRLSESRGYVRENESPFEQAIRAYGLMGFLRGLFS